jgi:2-phosphoglycerate kinase
MNENELEIEKLKMKIQSLENEKKVERMISKEYMTNRVIHGDKICSGLFIGGTMGVPISIISGMLAMKPTIGMMVDIIMIAITSLAIAIVADDENPLLR